MTDATAAACAYLAEVSQRGPGWRPPCKILCAMPDELTQEYRPGLECHA
jgi:hypothetical protein